MKKSIIYGFSSLLILLTTSAIAETTVQKTEQFQQLQPIKTTVKATQNVVKQTSPSNLNSVNINTATAIELQNKLIGIGAKKAQAIVEYREKSGQFMSIEQMTEVSGIGNATLEKNRNRIFIQ